MRNHQIFVRIEEIVSVRREQIELRSELALEKMLNELGKIALADIGKVVKWRYVRVARPKQIRHDKAPQ